MEKVKSEYYRPSFSSSTISAGEVDILEALQTINENLIILIKLLKDDEE